MVFDQEQVGGRTYSALASTQLKGATVTGVSLLPYRIFNYGQPIFIQDPLEKQRAWDMFQVPTGSLTL